MIKVHISVDSIRIITKSVGFSPYRDIVGGFSFEFLVALFDVEVSAVRNPLVSIAIKVVIGNFARGTN